MRNYFETLKAEHKQQSLWQKSLRCSLNLLLPQRCLCCELPSNNSLPICQICYQNLPWLENVCQRCAMPLLEPAGTLCGRCASAPPAWNKCFVLWRHATPVASWINQLKHGHRLHLARFFGILIAAKLKQQQINIDAILPMPLHKERLKKRGFNQALEIARHCKVASQPRILRSNIIRSKATPAQQGLSKSQRQRNMQGAFALKKISR